MAFRSNRGWAAAFVVQLTACATLGQGNLDQARDALKNNEPAAALVAASEAIIANPEFADAKVFLRDSADGALKQAMDYLARTERTTAAEALEKRFLIYSDLVKFYDNLKKIGLPLTADAQFFGLIKSWEWTTVMLDFRTQKEVARSEARLGVYASGVAAIIEGDLSGASSLMSKVVGLFAVKDSAEQSSDRRKIAVNFLAWADTQRQSNDPDQLIKGIEAYDLALKYDSMNTAAGEGRALMKLRLSDRYVVLGLAQERVGGVAALKHAIALFQNALKYNGANDQAATGIPRAERRIAEIFFDEGAALERSGRLDDLIAAHGKYEEALKWDAAFINANDAKFAVTEKIADRYYQTGVRLGANRKSAESVEQAIAAFAKAGEWFPDYKDSVLLGRRLLVSRQILIIEDKIDSARVEFIRTQQRLTVLADLLTSAKSGMDDLTASADSILCLDDQLTALGKTANALAAIPGIGSAPAVTAATLSKIQAPVNAAAIKIKRQRLAAIMPMRVSIEMAKTGMDKVAAAMDSIRTNLDYVRLMPIILDARLPTIADKAAAESIEIDAKELNKTMETLIKSLRSLNLAQDQAEGPLRAIVANTTGVGAIRDGVEKVMLPLNAIKGVTDEIADALKTIIKIPPAGGLTVEAAINSSDDAIKKAAEVILTPSLVRLGIEIPSVPDMDRFTISLDQAAAYYPNLKAAGDLIAGSAEEIIDAPNQFRARADAILVKSGISP